MLKDLLIQSKWRVFNVSIAKKIGLHETLVLMELADAEQYFKGDKFFLTYEKISDNTTLSEHQVRNAIKHLKELGIIDTSMDGMPAKQYFSIVGIDFLSGVGLDPPKSEGLDPLKNGGSIYKEPIEKEPIKKDKQKKKSLEGSQPKKYPENTEEYFGIASEQKPKRKTKLEISKEFYDNELKSGFEGFSAEVAKLYPGFVKFLYGRNSFDDPLTGVLGLEKQVSRKNFDELLKLSRQHNKKISDSVEAIENSKNGKYYKGRKSLYLILRKWLSNTNFDK